ncbi:MAG TPA: hypothetical protein VEJ84_09380, partial [Acidimicrobiales bacterium]|nr:hypothetical protein [Acidimicrobiales bacterium]
MSATQAPRGEAGDAALLDSTQMALFAAKGFLRFDAVVPQEINALCIDEMMAEAEAKRAGARSPLEAGNVAGSPLARCFRDAVGIRSMLELPLVRGLIKSLVGPDPLY